MSFPGPKALRRSGQSPQLFRSGAKQLMHAIKAESCPYRIHASQSHPHQAPPVTGLQLEIASPRAQPLEHPGQRAFHGQLFAHSERSNDVGISSVASPFASNPQRHGR